MSFKGDIKVFEVGDLWHAEGASSGDDFLFTHRGEESGVDVEIGAEALAVDAVVIVFSGADPVDVERTVGFVDGDRGCGLLAVDGGVGSVGDAEGCEFVDYGINAIEDVGRVAGVLSVVSGPGGDKIAVVVHGDVWLAVEVVAVEADWKFGINDSGVGIGFELIVLADDMLVFLVGFLPDDDEFIVIVECCGSKFLIVRMFGDGEVVENFFFKFSVVLGFDALNTERVFF